MVASTPTPNPLPTKAQAPTHVQAPSLAEDALTRAAALVSPALDTAVERLSPELWEPVRHHLAGGGKRVRAALVLQSAVAAGGTEDDAIDGAVAIELVHNYSLVHDDIIDEDRERRHRSTVWAEFGVGRAIIAGDLSNAKMERAGLASMPPLRQALAEYFRARRGLVSETRA